VPVPSKVLVAGVFRAPAIVNGPTLGESPKDSGSPSPGVPFPLNVPVPPFPALAYSSGVVVVEVRVDADGSVGDAAVVRSAPPFDSLAIGAARRFHFRPARVRGTAVSTLAYLVFGFPVPVGNVPASSGGGAPGGPPSGPPTAPPPR
jgi:TonB family protein